VRSEATINIHILLVPSHFIENPTPSQGTVTFCIHTYYLLEFVGCTSVQLKVTVTPFRSRLPRPWSGEGEAIWIVPLLRAEGSEEEFHVGFVATEDGRPTEAEAMILPLAPDEALVVDVARGLDCGRGLFGNTRRETRGKGTVYTRHQSET